MTYELIGEYPAADDCEQMGRFLRHAFPLGLRSFAELPFECTDEMSLKTRFREIGQTRDQSAA
jgi:hypothetical protein